MPLLPSYTEADAGRGHTVDQSWDEILSDIQRSPGYQLLNDDGVGVPTCYSRASEDGKHSAENSPRSDKTVKPGDDLEAGGVALSLGHHSGEPQTLMSPSYGAVGEKPPIYVSGPQQSPPPAMNQAKVLSSSGGTREVARSDKPYENFIKRQMDNMRSKGHGSGQDPFLSSPSCGLGSFNVVSPLEVKNSAYGQPMHGPIPGTPSGRGSAHHRRTASKFSFVSVQPSKHVPGHPVQDQVSEASRLVSSVPTKPRSVYAQHLHPNSAPVGKTSTLQHDQAIPFSWTQSTPESYSPFNMGPSNDPFVDHHSAAEKRAAVASTSGYTPHRGRAPSPATPKCSEPSQQELCHPVTGLSINDVKPIPPPSLLAGGFVQQPDAQARLDAHKAIRKEWIEKEARRIAAIARNAAFLHQQYLNTRRPEDYQAWNRAQAECQQAWSVETLTEQRRNLTLPMGMSALKAGQGSLPEDSMGGVEGGMLGHKMALMERICAEGMMKEDKCKMAADLLDDDSKKAVRQAVMRDVVAGTEKRRERQFHYREGDARTGQHQP